MYGVGRFRSVHGQLEGVLLIIAGELGIIETPFNICFRSALSYYLTLSHRQSQIIMWDVEKREVRHTFIGHSGIVMDMIVLPVLRTNPENWPRRALVSCSVDATIRVWDPQNRKELRVFRGHEKEVMCVAYSGTI